MQKTLRKVLGPSLKLLFSVALIYWLVTSGRLEFQSLSKLLDPAYLIPGLICCAVAIGLATQRWRQFLLSQSLSVSYYHALQLTLIGNFFNFAMPGGVGGDLVKGYYITRSSPHAKLDAAVTVFLDRLIGLLAMSLLALFVMLFRWDLVQQQNEMKFIFYVVALVNAASFIVWAHIFSRRLNEVGWIEWILHLLPKKEALLKTYRTITNYRNSKKVFASTLGLSLAAQAFSVLFFVFAARGLGRTDLPTSAFFVVVPIAFMIQSLPLSPAGVGVGQAASFFLFNLIQPGSGPIGTATTTAFQIVQFGFGLIGAYFYLGISKKIKASTPTLSQTEISP